MIYFPNLTNTHPSRALHISAVKRVLSGVLQSSHQYLENANLESVFWHLKPNKQQMLLNTLQK